MDVRQKNRGADSTLWVAGIGGLASRGLLTAGDRLLGQGMLRRLSFLNAAQWWSRERLHEHQNQCLARLLGVAYEEVPFYRDLMVSAGVQPEDILCSDDLHRLPIVSKKMLRSGYPGATCRPTRSRQWEVSSSGSTGENFVVRQDAETAGRLRALTLLGFSWAGWPLGAPHLQTGMTLQRGWIKKVKDILLRCTYESAFDLTDRHLDRMLDRIQRSGIRHIRGYPGSLYCMACRALARGIGLKLESIVTWGDNLFPHYRKAIETCFNCRVMDAYGCGEGVQVAAQCGHGENYHVFSTDVIVEVVDDNGRPVKDGETGHILLTRLHPGPMPLIRYQVGDLGVPRLEDSCSCGRNFQLLGAVQGRDTDVVMTPQGNRLIVHFFTGVLEHFVEIAEFQVVQEELNSIVISVVPTAAWDSSTAERVISALEEKGALGLHILVRTVDSIPRTPSGKRRFVLSRVARDVAGEIGGQA